MAHDLSALRVCTAIIALGLAITLGACGSSSADSPASATAGSSSPGAGGSSANDASAAGNAGNSTGAAGNAGNSVGAGGVGGSNPEDGGTAGANPDANIDASTSSADAGGTIDGASATDSANVDAGADGSSGDAATGTGGDGGMITGITGSTTDELVDDAVAKGLLDAEMGLVYKVYAVFGDPRLPPEFRVDHEQIDSPIMATVAGLYPTLSSSTQALLLPFFIPPIYTQSWYASRLPHPATQSAPSTASSNEGDTLAYDPPANLFATVFCALLSTTGITFNETVTPHFRIHAATGNYAFGGEAETAKIIADNAEDVYSKVTTAFQKEPPKDLVVSATCNGGDDKLDIYVTAGEIKPGTKAITIAYNGCGSPSFIVFKAASDPKKIRNTLAHEFFHTLDLGAYKYSAACKDYEWLAEATANLCMDIAFPNDQVEHDDYARYFAFGERMAPIDEPYKGTAYGSQGYSDYVFLQYLARKHGNSTVKSIWDGTEAADSLHALVAAVDSVGGGIKKVWPAFALASWNDTDANVSGATYGYDSFTYGIKKAFDDGDAGKESKTKSVKVDLQGAGRKTYDLLGSAPSFGNGKELPRLSVQADYFRFTDNNVRSVEFFNPLGLADIPELKVQAVIKVNGQWKTEDWTKSGFKTFCRDKKDEHIEELVVIHSNADGRRPQQGVPYTVVPKLAVSNVGCWRWEGTASNNGSGFECSATGLVYERYRAPQAPDGVPGRESFRVISGQVTGHQVISLGECTYDRSASGSASTSTDELMIDLDLYLGFETADRDILSGTGSTTLSTLNKLICPDGTTTTTSEDTWEWMIIPSGKAVNADGTSIEGSDSGGLTTTTWKLDAKPEP